MPVYVNTNISSLRAQRSLGRNQGAQDQSLHRLSTGLRINSAADDSAGLAISEKFKSQIRSLEQAQRNANDGISLIQVAEGSLAEMGDMLKRMRELAIQSANGTLTDSDRGFLQGEFNELVKEMARISSTTEFNGRKLLNGSASAGVSFQVGINDTADDRITVSIANVGPDKLGSSAGAAASTKINAQSISQASSAQGTLSIIDEALVQLSEVRSVLGAVQNRLTRSIENIGSSVENLSAANQRIRDVDVARETSSLTRNQILVQAGVSVLSQANSSPQVALSLLQ